MRKSLVLSILCGTLLPLALTAQSTPPAGVEVRGRVVDAATGEPVSGALVELRDTDRRAVSDTAGGFVMRGVPTGTHPWTISRLGYAKWEETEQVEEGDEFTIALLPRPEMLEGIRAVASQLDHRRLTSGVAVRSVDHVTLARATAPSALEAVKDYLDVTGIHCPTTRLSSNNNTPTTGSVITRTTNTRAGAIQDDPGDRGCAWIRGQMLRPVVFVDEQRTNGGLTDLANYRPQDLYTVESFSGGRMIRVLTVAFAERVARRRAQIRPLSF
ncbi:MAG TPA: carboxypeptidase-like regulatory domain-containing protein [Longimicrobium sp.]|nr:carboxypeptidase-like regulatory domain-containing protein [Longimicrobium sp.]